MKRRRITLRARILVTLGTLVVAILAVSGTLDIVDRHREHVEALQLRAGLVASALAAALTNPIWEYDEDAGLAALEGTLADPELVEALVLDDAGLSFAKVRHPKNPDDPEPVVARRNVVLASPTGELKPIGSVELRFTRALVLEKLRGDVIQAGLELLLLVGVVLVGLLVALRRFTGPLEEMTRVIEARAEGDLSLDIDPAYLARPDEVGAIARSLELDQQQRRDEAKLLEITSDVAGDVHVGAFLLRLASVACELVGAERCTVFVHDPKGHGLWSLGAENEHRIEVRPGQGLAGASFASGEVLRLDRASDDPRYDASVDGADARAMLCLPISTKGGARVALMQVLRGRPFRDRDVLRLRSLAAQAAVAIENGLLLEAMLDEKAYSDSILASLTDGVVSLDDQLCVAKMNAAATRILGVTEEHARGHRLRELLPDAENDFEIDLIERVARSRQPASAEDADLILPDGRPASVNLNAVPLRNSSGEDIGSLFVVEDITGEKRVRGTMARYLPKRVVDQLLAGDRAVLGGTAQTVTSLFSDIRSFTTISEEIGPRETVAMLNEYFTEMIEVLDRHNGILDKYIGDAVMAIFGVPYAGADDADNAVAAANEMMSVLGDLNVRRRERGQHLISIGVGLSTGEVVAGNIGSPKRLSYTVIGDPVNLASRLEGATKQYGVSILLSELTYAALTDRRHVREVDLLRVKGKTRPVAVYASHAYREDRDAPELQRSLERFAAGLAAFRGRRWTEARRAFEDALATQPRDPLPALYLERVALYEAAPPPDDWDGVWVMTSK